MPIHYAQTPKALHFNNAVGGIYYTPQGYIHLAWSAERMHLAELQTFYGQALMLLSSTGCRKILSEHGQRRPSIGAHEWIPRAMQQVRVEYCAIVDGTDPIHRLSTHTVITDAPAVFIFQRFATINEAEA